MGVKIAAGADGERVGAAFTEQIRHRIEKSDTRATLGRDALQRGGRVRVHDADDLERGLGGLETTEHVGEPLTETDDA